VQEFKTMRSLLVFAAFLLLACSVSSAQDSPAKPSFEVVSIRPGNGQPITLASGMRAVGAMQGGPGSADPERLTGNSVTVRSLLTRAFGVKIYQISGPAWIQTSPFDIAAKIPPGATKEQFNLMLQQMLEERFSMKLHHMAKEVPAFNLVVAKGGLKLRDSVSTDNCAMGARPAGGSCPEGASYQNGIMLSKEPKGMAAMAPRGSARIITGRAAALSVLANIMEGQLGGPLVIDKTGLPEAYDFRIEFAAPTASPDDDTPLPSLFTAVEKDLGLKLESTKTSIDVLVIDHIEQPSEN
jgi:uncharacterized protein (TIGR03435 family)